MRTRYTSTPRRPLTVCWALTVLAGLVIAPACTESPEHATDAASPQPATTLSTSTPLIRLSKEKIERAGIQIDAATRSEFRHTRDFPGTIEPNHHTVADITALVRGRVMDVYGDLGKHVAAGEILAILYSSDLGMAQSGYLKAKARLFVADRSYQRAKALLEEKVIGLAEAQRREGDLISARAEQREARDRLKLFGMTDELIASLDRDQTIKSYAPIVAPFAGRIIARDLTKGEVVETTSRLFQVADLSQVWVTANIPERDIPFIHSDQSRHAQKVDVRVKAYPDQVFPGSITYVGDVLDQATRTMRLRITLENPDGKLKPQMFATVRIYSEPVPDKLAVPEAAVQRDRDRLFVFVQREPLAFEVRDVSVGESDGHRVMILDGVQEGDQVVTKGAFFLKSELFGGQS